ncbi:hypothetical protein EVAR_33590_1 [Eumeta japonica]|uniref:Uncharacterized protein n=1 Tax=Eumeta variegata TaxID=151549 RepID=A0A4C1WCI9_EUMVA|nr:hypothetical protein EVAR_33590_1 [Eumeta japonica]
MHFFIIVKEYRDRHAFRGEGQSASKRFTSPEGLRFGEFQTIQRVSSDPGGILIRHRAADSKLPSEQLRSPRMITGNFPATGDRYASGDADRVSVIARLQSLGKRKSV